MQGARADDDKAKVSLEQAKSSDLQVAEANLDARKSTLDKARADLQRATPLAERQEISAQEFDHYRTQAEVAESEWRAAQRRLAGVRQEAEIRQANVGAQVAKVGPGQRRGGGRPGQPGSPELQLSYTRIIAPVDGVVTRKLWSPARSSSPARAC